MDQLSILGLANPSGEVVAHSKGEYGKVKPKFMLRFSSKYLQLSMD